ncbi:MAG: maleylpyruvate isomerase family mycothiol-dependent enzyme [Acidimicrobiales bacterium]|nr:maleylpyruvate isomerase family mycothiol-dependent enzyme [Acidimicrobiales bacterium]
MPEGDHVTLPPGLRQRVLEAATAARAAGRATPEVAEIPPAEAFRRSADAFYRMLCALSDEDWRRPVLRDLDVQGLVGHLVGVEDDTERCLSGDPAVAEGDHVGSTQSAAIRQAGRPPVETRDEWRRAADRTLTLAQARDDLETWVAVRGLHLPLGALLVVRAFELWTHESDIRQVTGLPPAVPDSSTLHVMTELAAGLLPFAAAVTGLQQATRLRLVLTGPGGGTWDVEIGEGQPEPANVAIVADAVGFCRLVANRAVPDDLELHITGDEGRAAQVLAAASALALD